jgi:hypothetical protein
MQAALEVLGRVLFVVAGWMVSLSLQLVEWSKALGRAIQDPGAVWLRELLQSVLQSFARSALEAAVYFWRHGVDVFAQAPTFGPTVLPTPSDLVLGAVAIAIPLGMLYAMFFGLAWLVARQAG